MGTLGEPPIDPPDDPPSCDCPFCEDGRAFLEVNAWRCQDCGEWWWLEIEEP